MSSAKKRIPNTYIIGVQKAGTTSLDYWLSQHPQVFGHESMKDVDVLADPRRSESSLEYFSRAFEELSGEKVVLHSQVNYIFYRHAIRNLHDISPNAQLILILRDPVERAFSAYSYFRKLNLEKRSIEEALMYTPRIRTEHSEENSNFSYLEHGMYFEQISYLLEFFDREQVLILEFEELKNNPALLLNKVYSFLGIDYFVPDMNSKNVTGKVRLRGLQNALSHTSPRQRSFMKRYVDPWFPIEKRQAIKKSLRELNTNKNAREKDSVLPEKVRFFLQNTYKEDVSKLQQLVGETYSKNWLLT